MARLATFLATDGREAVGAVVEDELIELVRAGTADGPADREPGRDAPGMRAWLGRPDLADVVSRSTAAARAGDVDAERRHPLGEVRLRPPVPDPRKIVGVGLNYRSHADEAGRDASEYPVLFAKFGNTIAGPYDPIRIPRVTHRIDYEGELAVVIGIGGRYIRESDAWRHIAGYMVANDVSARDYQFRTKEMLSGKTFDGFAPTGPFVVTPDEVGELSGLRLTTHVNGEQRQSATLGEMLFSVPALVAYISDIVTFEPGDIILTGTPAGIGATMEPRRWLRADDEVVVEIERIGTIRNRVVAEPVE